MINVRSHVQEHRRGSVLQKKIANEKECGFCFLIYCSVQSIKQGRDSDLLPEM